MSAAPDMSFFRACWEQMAVSEPWVVEGRVRAVVGDVIEAEGLEAGVGDLCRVDLPGRPDGLLAEVVGFRDEALLLMPMADATGVARGTRLRRVTARAGLPRPEACLGRVIDALGRPLDEGPPLACDPDAQLLGAPVPPLARAPIAEPLVLGVRAIDALTTVARGARVGLFAGSGVGKSTLLGQIARGVQADVVVVGLVGERGREVREFVERELAAARQRSVVVVATSDEAAALRRRCAWMATAIAERFRDQGLHVLLLMDSVTRFCTAQREIGLAAGEPPATRGHPPSLWSVLPKLVERAGNGPAGEPGGSITGVYTVLVEGDDMDEPVADALRALLDGHVVLSRELASRGQFPAIDVLASVSRLMDDVVEPPHRALARQARESLATYRKAEDLISIGAYVAGSDPAVDEACRRDGPLRHFLAQASDECSSLEATLQSLASALGAPALPVAQEVRS